ncbi:hypothetical protein RvY_15071 [Ramazzottius varieornatus]|uniref:Uncharacterized protein n=1 Tax=Ramazzottius varieornatus TaxID=947166 RepID=A0A1D1W1T8_RAMVA|nr:hypothetical protein RvY_15071 [Ramazzottius varieornatus]
MDSIAMFPSLASDQPAITTQANEPGDPLPAQISVSDDTDSGKAVLDRSQSQPAPTTV